LIVPVEEQDPALPEFEAVAVDHVQVISLLEALQLELGEAQALLHVLGVYQVLTVLVVVRVLLEVGQVEALIVLVEQLGHFPVMVVDHLGEVSDLQVSVVIYAVWVKEI
jgi:hypothetical protein